MRILITGAAGLIGRQLTVYLCQLGHQVIPVDIVKTQDIICADLRDENISVNLLKCYNPNLIIHLAALKNLQFCETNKEQSRAANYGITAGLARGCSEFNIRLIYFSSDYVFGESDQAWKESDPTCPILQYGVDKADSESLIQEKLSDFAIIRTAQLYGFPGDFVSLVCKTILSERQFHAFSNLVNCPTWIGDLFAMLNTIIIQHHTGIFHCVGTEAVSRYQFACEIAAALKFNVSYIYSIPLNFLTDIRPPVVKLNGVKTYHKLQYYPGKLKVNLPRCASYAMNMI